MQIFKCFGCGVGGNVFTFIEKIENLSFYESVEFLADRANITLPKQEFDKKFDARRSLKETIAKINKDAIIRCSGDPRESVRMST